MNCASNFTGYTEYDRMPAGVVDTTSIGVLVTANALCPDLLRYEQIGEADGWRGRTVRAFFWLMRAWPTGGR